MKVIHERMSQTCFGNVFMLMALAEPVPLAVIEEAYVIFSLDYDIFNHLPLKDFCH